MAIMVAFTYPSKKKARSAGERKFGACTDPGTVRCNLSAHNFDQNAGPANLGRLYRFAPSGSDGSCT
jgi:hypothetical protein